MDVKPKSEWHQVHDAAENVTGDLSLREHALDATAGVGQVYMLAADMGGMGFIENNKALCMLSVLTSTHMLQAAKEQGVERYFYSSSACVYAAGKQTQTDVTALREEDAYPALPEDGYGWEKCSRNECVGTSLTISGSLPGLRAITMSTGPAALGTADARRLSSSLP